MGANGSLIFSNRLELDPDTVIKYTQETGFKSPQVVALWDRYRNISSGGGSDSTIDYDEFMKALDLKNPEIGRVMFKMADINKKKQLNFHEFITVIAVFRPEAPIDRKIDYCFKAYDEDNGGSVSKEEIEKIINLSLNGNAFMTMTKEQVDMLVDDLFVQYATREDGDMSPTDFANMVKKAPGIIDCFEVDMDTILANK